MSTFSEDVDAVAGYSHPTQVAANAFQSKSGITRVILPEECVGINQQSFSSMADLESVVISSQTRISGKQSFSSCKKLSTITPHGMSETLEAPRWSRMAARLRPKAPCMSETLAKDR